MYKLQNMSSKFKDFLPADLFLFKKSKIRKTSSQDQLIFQKSHQTQPITIVNLKNVFPSTTNTSTWPSRCAAGKNSIIFRKYAHCYFQKAYYNKFMGMGPITNLWLRGATNKNQESFQSNPGSSWEEINPLQYSSESFDINDNVNQTTKMGLIS